MSRKFIKVFNTLLGIILLFGSVSAAAAAPATKAPKVFVNGIEVVFQVEPIIENGTTLVQMRPIFKSLGFGVSYWHDQYNKAHIDILKDGVSFSELNLNSKNAYIDGKLIKLSAAPKVVKQNAMVPLRFVSEATGYKVEWKKELNRIDINSDPDNNGQSESDNSRVDEFSGHTFGMSKEQLELSREGTSIRANSNGNDILMYNHTFETGQQGKAFYKFDNNGLSEVTFMTNATAEFDELFGVYTLFAMDMAYKYNNGSGKDDFVWETDNYSIQAYESLYKGQPRLKAEMAMKNKELTLAASYNLSNGKVLAMMYNSGTSTSPQYVVALIFSKN